MHIINLLSLICLFGVSQILCASDTIKLQSGRKYLPGRNIKVLEDPSKSLSVADISSAKYDSMFSSVKSDIPNFSLTKSAIWVKFSVLDSSGTNDKWLLQINYPPLQKIDFYYKDSTGNYHLKRIGAIYPHDKWETKARMPVLSLPMYKKILTTFYLRIESKTSIVLPMIIITEDEFAESSRNNYFMLGGYYGIILVMFFYNLFLFIPVKEKEYLYYVFYLAGYGLYQFTVDGLGYQFLWPDYPGWNLIATMFFIGLYYAFGALFTKSFLQIDKQNKLLNHLLVLSIFLGSLVSITVFFIPFQIIDRLASYYAFLFVPLLLGAGIHSWKRGFKPAKYYLIAISFLLTGVLLRAARILGIVPMSFSATFGWQIGSLLEMVLLSFALGNKIRSAREDKRREVEKVRGEIASDLHDEIGSNLGSIGLMIQRTIKCADIPLENRQELKEVSDTIFKTADSLRDIVWFIAPDHEFAEQRIAHLHSVTGKLLQNIEYEFNVDPAISQKKDLKLHRYLYLMYKEILHNIVKHSGATHVKIDFQIRENYLIISISDNGKGIDINSIENGMGIKNLKKRAQTIGAYLEIFSRPHEGTDVIISLKLDEKIYYNSANLIKRAVRRIVTYSKIERAEDG